MNEPMNPQPSDHPSGRDVETAYALAVLGAHVEVRTDTGLVCAVCVPTTVFPCEFVILARRTLGNHDPDDGAG